jgi:hypothetical protein
MLRDGAAWLLRCPPALNYQPLLASYGRSREDENLGDPSKVTAGIT